MTGPAIDFSLSMPLSMVSLELGGLVVLNRIQLKAFGPSACMKPCDPLTLGALQILFNADAIADPLRSR